MTRRRHQYPFHQYPFCLTKYPVIPTQRSKAGTKSRHWRTRVRGSRRSGAFQTSRPAACGRYWNVDTGGRPWFQRVLYSPRGNRYTHHRLCLVVPPCSPTSMIAVVSPSVRSSVSLSVPAHNSRMENRRKFISVRQVLYDKLKLFCCFEVQRSKVKAIRRHKGQARSASL